MEENGETKRSRDKLSQQTVSALKDLIHLSDKSREAIYEEFDPVLILNESVEANLPRMLELVLTFDGNDEEFVDELKAEGKLIIGEAVGDIEEGFIEGLNDVIPFLKENVSVIIKAATDPAKAALAAMMGVPPIMKYIESTYQQYQKDKEEGKLPAKKVMEPKDEEKKEEDNNDQITPTSDACLSDALSKASSDQEKREILLSKYNEVLQRDQTNMQQRIPRPLSRAYQSLDLTADNALSVEEEMKAKQAYFADRSEKAKSKAEYFKDKMKESINDSGRFKSAEVDVQMKGLVPESIPEDLRQAYFDMIKAGIKSRLAEDQDYGKLKNSGRFDYLDML